MPKPGASRGKRPKLVPPSEEMKHLSALLARELLRWPDIRMRPMFGLRAFYRRAVVFAMLPDKRALESPTAIAYKLAAGAQKEGRKWRLFELESAQDMGKALARLDEAYNEAVAIRK